MHGDPAHATVLLRLLEDPNRAVVLAAVEALGVPGAVTDPVPLERLQASDDGAIRVAAARSLAINGFASGSATLARLATDADAETRREAVAAMGQLRDVAFLDPLMGRLDDELSVRLATIVSLAQIVGHDVNVEGWSHAAAAGRPGARLEAMVGRTASCAAKVETPRDAQLR